LRIGHNNDLFGVIGKTSFAALDTMVTSTAQPSPIACTEFSTMVGKIQTAKNYTATTAISYIDKAGAAVTDATTLKTLEDGFLGFVPGTCTAQTDGTSFYSTQVSNGAVDAFMMHESKPYEVVNTDDNGDILANGAFNGTDVSKYGSDVWSIAYDIGAIETDALKTLNVFDATVTGTVTTYTYDFVDNADLIPEIYQQHAYVAGQAAYYSTQLVDAGFTMMNVAKADSANNVLELISTVRFYNSTLNANYYLNFDTTYSAIGTTVVPTIDSSKITWVAAAA
jgi:hypothetical protein